MKDSGSEDDHLVARLNKDDPDLYRRQTVVSAGEEKDPKEWF